MRVIGKGSELKAAAYAGTYVVVLAWDTLDGKMPSRTDLLGYAIERAELDLSGNEVERYWMRGIKRFKERDKGLPPGTPVSTAEHPIQSFLWADYTAKAGTHYRFRIVHLIQPGLAPFMAWIAEQFGQWIVTPTASEDLEPQPAERRLDLERGRQQGPELLRGATPTGPNKGVPRILGIGRRRRQVSGTALTHPFSPFRTGRLSVRTT
jgi:hypothetical protein